MATLYARSWPAPIPQGYRHTGMQSYEPFGDGLRAALEIPSPSVPGGDVVTFVAGRLLAKTGASSAGYSTWIEAGWVKMSLTVNAGYERPCAYGFNGSDHTWHVYCGLDLRIGRSYLFEIEDVGGGVQSSVLWNGTWYVLEASNVQTCRGKEAGTALCNWEAYLEPSHPRASAST